MAEHDLSVRAHLAEIGELYGGYHREMRAVHRHNGARLREIIEEVEGWPGYRLVGPEGSEAAFLIAQHDVGNPQLVRRCRELYAAAVEIADADPRRLAYLDDRIRYLEGRCQRYGTHLGWNTEGELGPWPPVEDPARIDERRASLGLPPLSKTMAAAEEHRPARRPVDEVLDEHRKADDFARQAGWRDG